MDRRQQVRDWLLTSALSTLMLLTIWSVSTLASALTESRELDSGHRAIEDSTHAVLSRVATHSKNRTKQYYALYHPTREQEHLRQMYPARLDSLLDDHEATVHLDSGAVAALRPFAPVPEVQAYIDVWQALLEAERAYWMEIRAQLDSGVRPWQERFNSPGHAWGTYVVSLRSFDLSSAMYEEARVQRYATAHASARSRRMRVSLALLVLAVAGLTIFRLWQYSHGPAGHARTA